MKRSRFKSGSTAVVAAIVMGSWLIPAAPAVAAPGAMIVPATGNVQGIVGNHCGLDDTHAGTDISTTAGGPIVAAAAGTVTIATNDGGGYGTTVVITHTNGYKTRYGHMIVNSLAVRVDQQVAQGQVIGQMGTTGQSTGVHLHFEVLINDEPQPGLNTYFPCLKDVRRGDPIGWDFPGLDGAAPNPERTAVLRTNGDLQVKEGITGGWVVVARNVVDYSLAGTRVAIVNDNSQALVKEGALNNRWTVLWNGAKDVEMNGSRIGITDQSNTFRVKEGPINAGWTVVEANTAQASLSGSRIAVRLTNNQIKVKEGAVNAGWTLVENGTDVSIDGSRIGIVALTKVARVKEGPVNADWTDVATSASKVIVSGNRIAVLSPTNKLDVKEGPVNALWTHVADGVTSFSLSGQKIAQVTGGTAQVKTGPVNAGWTTVETTTRRVTVAG